MANLEKRVSDLEETVEILKNSHPVFRSQLSRKDKTENDRKIANMVRSDLKKKQDKRSKEADNRLGEK